MIKKITILTLVALIGAGNVPQAQGMNQNVKKALVVAGVGALGCGGCWLWSYLRGNTHQEQAPVVVATHQEQVSVIVSPVIPPQLLVMNQPFNAQASLDLLEAAKSGNVQKCVTALRQGADVNTKEPNQVIPDDAGSDDGETSDAISMGGSTPLHIACIYGHVEIAWLLLKNGAQTEIQNQFFLTPLHLACGKEGNLEIVKLLLENGARTEAQWGKQKPAQRELDSDDDDGDEFIGECETPLHLACEAGYLEIVKLLLAYGAQKEAMCKKKGTPLHKACWHNHLETVRYLVENGANIEARNNLGYTPLIAACRAGHLDIVTFLVGKGAQIETKEELGYTAFHTACDYGKLKVARFLASKGANSRTTNRTDQTPLHSACCFGYLDVVKFLVEEQGADVNVTTPWNETPLHEACKWHGHLDVVKFLLAKGADTTIKTRLRELSATPLHEAVHDGDFDIVKFMVSQGVAVQQDQIAKAKTPEIQDFLRYMSLWGQIKTNLELREQVRSLHRLLGKTDNPVDQLGYREEDRRNYQLMPYFLASPTLALPLLLQSGFIDTVSTVCDCYDQLNHHHNQQTLKSLYQGLFGTPRGKILYVSDGDLWNVRGRTFWALDDPYFEEQQVTRVKRMLEKKLAGGFDGHARNQHINDTTHGIMKNLERKSRPDVQFGFNE